jgi:23S rRNA (guanosine2251-2'-O)-methyltransferase
MEIIVGLHSVAHALQNSERVVEKLYLTEEGRKELKSKHGINLKPINHEVLKKTNFQTEAQKVFKKHKQTYHKITTGCFLICEELEEHDVKWLYDRVQSDSLKILCLDQITDVHNGAAIFRTASFYGVDVVLLPTKGAFSFTPGFYRISSGAREHIQIVRSASFPKTISKLQELGVDVLALSEHAEKDLDKFYSNQRCKMLILGAEETGISNAIMRIVENKLRLESKGEIKSLNVSVAAALAMEKTFS